MISYEDFAKLDIRSGTIIEVKDFPGAKKPAWQLSIDFGSIGIKKSSAQIKSLYSKEQLLNRQVIAVVNFPPKQIANFFSECLVLGVHNEQQEVVLLQPERSVSNGSKIS
jgi:tRNA-binding protein